MLIKLMATHLIYRDALEKAVTPERAAKLLAPATREPTRDAKGKITGLGSYETNQAAYPYLDPRLYQIGKEDLFLLKCMSECGLTPAARARIRIQKPKAADPFDRFKNRRKTAA